jgi:hypothetical protein
MEHGSTFETWFECFFVVAFHFHLIFEPWWFDFYILSWRYFIINYNEMFVYKIAWYVYDHKNQIEINKTNYLI